jgi:hypothetical protein
MKKLIGILACLFVIAAGVAFAATGTPPLPGSTFALPDSNWLNGLAGGGNETFVSGIKAAGTTQATATQLPAGIAIIEIDTVPGSSGVNLPPAIAGTEFTVFNSTGTTILFYPSVANNPITATQDTINAGTSFSVTGVSGPPTGTLTFFACAKNGIWAAK